MRQSEKKPREPNFFSRLARIPESVFGKKEKKIVDAMNEDRNA